MSKQKLPADISVTADTIEHLVSEGMTQQQVAMHLGITQTYLSDLKRKHPKIKEAIVKGRQAFVRDLPKVIQDSIIKQIQGYEYVEVETLYDVELDEHGREIEVVRARRKTKRHIKPNSSITQFAAKAILRDWEDSDEVKDEKSDIDERLEQVRKDQKLVDMIRKTFNNALKAGK